ncbi:hypothetical protein ACOSQ3_021743 [Xanthoceras sorbifolium]
MESDLMPKGANWSCQFGLFSRNSPVAADGAAAGIITCHPLEVLKDQLTVSHDMHPILSIAISKITRMVELVLFMPKSLNHPEMLMVGAIAGLTASTISFPWKLPEKRLMVGEHCKVSEGLMGLCRGGCASCLKAMPPSGITWMFYESLERHNAQ